MSTKIGITEGSDAALDNRWYKWVKDGKPAILLTKSPKLLYEQLQEFEKYNIITHLTITGNAKTILEPNVPDTAESIEYFKKFLELIGNERVILRIDPIIPVMPYLKNSYDVLDKVKSLCGKDIRIRISIYDNYKHTDKRLKELGIDLKYEGFHYPLYARRNIWKIMGEPNTCGEPGLPSTPCLSEYDCKILGVEPGISERWQRKDCGCLNNKIELTPLKEPCKHNCAYCFWKDKH